MRSSLLACLLVPLVLTDVGADPPVKPDPLPLRRILIPPSRVAAELERARQGTLVKMPREEFEGRLRQAATAGELAANPPRLLRTAYTARLEGSALVGGGDWTVTNPGANPGVLPLPDFNLALRKLTFDDATAAAVLGDLDGKALGLLVARPGKQSVFFDWSLRGGAAGGELHFDLQVPACPAASLELTLPADHTVSVSRTAALLSGPHEAADPRMRLWRIQFAGRSRLDLAVRRPEGAARVPRLVLAHLQATQQLAPQSVSARYEFHIEVLHNAVSELVFDCDPALEPYDVTVARGELLAWDIARPAGKNGPAVTVRLREPFQGSLQPLRVTVLCLAKPDRSWVSPGMRLRDAAYQTEELKLEIPPDVRLENFRPGRFRLTQTGAGKDGARVLTLADGNPAAGPTGRPAATVRTHGVDFLTRQRVWWRVGPSGSTLTAEVTWEVTRGNLLRLPLRIPGRWQVDEVQFAQKPGGNLVSAAGKGALLLVAEPLQPVAPGKPATLLVRLRSPLGKNVPAAGETLAFPELDPLEARLRTGELAITVDPAYQATVAQVSHPPAVPSGAGPGDKAVPDYYYLHKEKAVTGKLRLVPRRPRFTARVAEEVRFGSGGAALAARLQLEPVAGAPEAIDLLLSAPTSGRWAWSAEGQPGLVRGVERLRGAEACARLLPLAARGPLEAAVSLAARPRGERWRLLLGRTLARRETVTLQTTLAAPGAAGQAQQWDVPLLTVAGADRMEGELTLHLVGTELLRVNATAVRATGRDPPRGAGAGRDAWRTFRYGPQLFPAQAPALRVRSRTLEKDVSSREVCDRARLTTYAEPGGRLLHHFRFRVWNWRQGGLQVLLPSGVQLLAAKVEGRWLDRLERQDGPQGQRVELPVPDGANPLHFEVIYASAGGPSWAPWARLDAPPPVLPVPPASFECTWRLPPGVVPLSASARRRPDPLGPRDREPWWAAVRRAWRTGRDWLAELSPDLAPEARANADRRALAEAEEALRRQHPAGKGWLLGDTLARLAAGPLERRPLVVDAVALRAAALGPASPLRPAAAPAAAGTPDLLASLALAYVPCEAAVLLTTRGELASWEASAGEGAAPSGAVEQAVAEAVAHGRDASGRFQTALYWLRRHGGAEPPDSAADGPPALAPDSFGGGWTEWEALPGGGGAEVLVVVREGGVRVLGLTLAGLFGLVVWRGRRALPRRWRYRLLMLWLAVSGAALIWLPPALREAARWPALAGLAVALAVCVRAGGRLRERGAARREGSTERPAKAAALSALALFALFSPPLFSQGPEPAPVLILGADGAAGRESVLVTPDLLKKLDELARRGQPRGAVLLSAAYTGKVTGDRAEFTAEFQVYCPAEEATLALPLAGVELKEGALWAGAPVYPVAAPAPQRGYLVPVRRRGPQAVNTLQLSFGVRLPVAVDARELRFTVPRLAQNRLVVTLPPGALAAQAVNGVGAQTLASGPGAPRLEVDLGREPVALVRWRLSPRGPRPVSLEVRETYLWDLRPPAATLTAALRYTVGNGTAPYFTLALPEGLEVRSVDVGQVGAPPEGTPVARLKDWEVKGKGGGRHLRIEPQSPVAGEVQVTLGLLPRLTAAPGTLRLSMPAPQLPAKSVEVALAYTVDGFAPSVRAPELAVVVSDLKTFPARWQELGMRDPVDPLHTHAHLFRRKQGVAVPVLTLKAPRPEARQEVAWRVHPRHADFEASAVLTSAGRLMLAEWDVPGNVTVAAVRGPRVRHWTWADGRVQLWLSPGGAEKDPGRVELSGWVQYPQPKPGGEGRFALPCLRLLSADLSQNLVRVSASPELTLVPDREPSFPNLQRLPDAEADGPFLYRAAQPWYGGSFLFRASPVAVAARVLTVAEVRDGVLTVTGRLDYEVAHGEMRTAAVRLRHWEGEVRLEAPGAVVHEQPGKQGERRWLLTVPAGVTRQFSVKVTGSLPLRAGAAVPMPDLSAPDATPAGRWLAVLGPGVRAEAASGLAPVEDAAAALAAWPAEAEGVRPGGAAWRVARDDWSLRLVGRPAGSAPGVLVLYAEQEAAVTDLRRWLHQATYWLHADSGTDLRLQLPRGARLLAANLDGVAVDPRQPEPDRLALPLSGGEGLRVLRLRWAFEPGAEALAEPNLEPPRFKGVEGGAVLWRVDVPAGYRLRQRQAAADEAAPAGAAVAELARAEAHLRQSALLVERLRTAPTEETWGQLLAARRQFLRHARQAADLLAAGEGVAAGAGPKGAALADWLADLRKQDARLVRGPGLEKLRSLAEKPAAAAAAPTFFALPERGLPAYWYAAGPSPPPQPALTADGEDRWREAVFTTELLALALALAGVLACLPRVQAWLWRLLPEALVLLAWLGWQAFGLSPLALLLFVTGVCARMVLLGAWLSRVLRPARPAEASGSSFPPG